jgi:tetratricopeptide (TPR) repeat protein
LIKVLSLELPEVIRDPLGAFVHRLRRSLPAEEIGGDVQPHQGPDQQAAQELFNRGVELARAGQAEEAFGVYDALLTRFVEKTEVQEQVAWALLNMGLTLASVGRANDEIAVYDELLRRFGSAVVRPQLTGLARPEWLKGEQEPSSVSQERATQLGPVAWALFNKGVALGILGRTQEALASYNELLHRFGPATQPSKTQVGGLTLPDWLKGDRQVGVHAEEEAEVREAVAWALFNRGVILKGLGHMQEAVAVFDDLLNRFSEVKETTLERLTRPGWLSSDSPQDPNKKELREQVSWALFNKAVALGTLGRTRDSLATYDDLLRRYAGLRGAVTGGLVRPGWLKGTKKAGPTDPDVREQVAWTLFNKGVTLGGLGRTQEAVTAYNELLSRFGESREPDVQEQVSRAVLNMGVLEATLQEQIAREPASQGTTLGSLGSAQDPSGFFDQAVKPVQHSTTTERPAGSARDLMARAITLGNTEEAIAVYDELIARFGHATEMQVRKYVAQAMVNQGEVLATLGGQQEAMEVYDAIIRSFGGATEPELREQVARAQIKKETLVGTAVRPVEPEPVAPQPVAPQPVVPEPAPPESSPPEPISHQPVEEEGETLGTLGEKQETLSPGEYATETDLPHEAASALVAKGVALGTPQEAIEVYDEVISRFGTTSEAEVSGVVAEAMVHKVVALGTLGLTKDAIAVCDEVISRFGTAQQPVLREQVAEAVAKKEALEAIAVELEEEQEERGTREQAEKEAQEAEEKQKAEEQAAKEARASEEKRKAQEKAEKETQEAEEKRKAQEVAEKEAQEAEEQQKAQEAVEREAQRREPQELIEKAVGLGSTEEAIAVYDEVVSRFEEVTELGVRELVADALIKKGLTLGALGRMEAAIEVCDELVKSFGRATDIELKEKVGGALVTKEVALASLGRMETVIEVCDEVMERFGEASQEGLQGQVLETLSNKAVALKRLGRMEEVVQVCDEVIGRLSEATQAVAREKVAGALFHKWVALSALGQMEEVIEVCDEIINRYQEAQELSLQEQVARAMVEKGVMLGTLGKMEEEIEIYDEVITRFQETQELVLREQMVKALVNKGVALGTLGRTEETLTVCDEVVGRFQDAEELVLREQVSKALVNKGVALGTLGRLEETIEVCDEVLKRHQEAQEVELQEQVALALVNKGVALGSLKRIKEAIAIYTEVVHRFEGEMLLQGQVIRAKELCEALKNPDNID